MQGGDGKPFRLFYSYSHEDEELRLKLQEHLSVLRRRGRIAEWHDRDIDAGSDWAKEIDRNLASADIILCLVSPSFIASDYCWEKEMTKALERHRNREARVIPVILRPCDWMKTPLASLQAVPQDALPVTRWPDLDQAFLDVTQGIRRAIGELALRRSLPDLAVFKDIDAPWCPEMVVIPAGEFLMGSQPSEEGRYDDEGPQHRVTIGRRFALGRYAVTFGEYDHFCEVTDREKPADEGWGRGRQPVINVSWRDARAYVEWLSGDTRQPYRLPSEAEWEYACRAGTPTPFSFGETVTSSQVNYDGNYTYAGGAKGFYRKKKVPVGSLPANPWGLHEMHGNVWEWVEDVWHDSYSGAPVDGTAWTEGEGLNSSRNRVYRGGSRNNHPRNCRSAYRSRVVPGGRYGNQGFRVARTLD
jgi:formylglycine-generating enzyme required for sulfatase activity